MKNILLLLLTLGLAVSLFYNWKSRTIQNTSHDNSGETGKDSLNLSLVFEEEQNNNARSLKSQPQAFDTVVYKVSSQMDENGKTQYIVCCPTPPIDTSAVFSSKHYRLRFTPVIKMNKITAK